MTIYNPLDFNGIGESGNVNILKVEAALQAYVNDFPYDPNAEYHIPFTVNFRTVGSVGQRAILLIETIVPMQRDTDIASWEPSHRFNREGVYNVTLTVIGGSALDMDSLVIEALAAEPEGSVNLIIRAVKLAAIKELHEELDATGEQV